MLHKWYINGEQQKCYINGTTPKMINDELKELVVKKETVLACLLLHVWIRFFECYIIEYDSDSSDDNCCVYNIC